jgi:uncharacterized membrane protein YfcA
MALGTIVGSFVAVEVSDAVLDVIVIASLLFVLGLLLVRPRRWIGGRGGALRPFDRGQAAAYFVIGLYAGLVVLGSGFVVLAALVLLTGCDLKQGNAMKAFVLLVVGLQSLLIFADARGGLGLGRTAGGEQRDGGVRGRTVGCRGRGQSLGLPLPDAPGHPGDRAAAGGR